MGLSLCLFLSIGYVYVALSFVFFFFLPLIRQTCYIFMNSNLSVFFFMASEFCILPGKAFPIPDHKEFLLWVFF